MWQTQMNSSGLDLWNCVLTPMSKWIQYFHVGSRHWTFNKRMNIYGWWIWWRLFHYMLKKIKNSFTEEQLFLFSVYTYVLIFSHTKVSYLALQKIYDLIFDRNVENPRCSNTQAAQKCRTGKPVCTENVLSQPQWHLVGITFTILPI